MRTLVSWSGGKDSCFAMMEAIEQGYRPVVLLNVMNEYGERSRSHGLPASVLQQQAAAANIPIHLISSSWQDYEEKFVSALQVLKSRYELTHAVFGDIDLQAHRDWEEKVTQKAGLTALLPLWQQERKELLIRMLDAGIETMIISCNETMGPRFLGRILDKSIIAELEDLNIDPCGENGEFHTVVINSPLFKQPVSITIGEKLEHEGYWFLESK